MDSKSSSDAGGRVLHSSRMARSSLGGSARFALDSLLGVLLYSPPATKEESIEFVDANRFHHRVHHIIGVIR